MRFAACLVLVGAAIASTGIAAAAPSEPSREQLLRSLPLRFEQDAQGRWTSHGSGFAFLFDRQATFFHAADSTVQLTFEGASPDASFEASGSMAAANYFIGHSYRSAAGFSHLERRAIYPGVDVVFYGKGQQLEYDFNLAPGADPSRIRMRFSGAGEAEVNARGEIVLKLGSGELVQRVPVVYQKRGSESVAVEAAYTMAPDGSIGLKLGKYNRARALVVDPAILYTAFLGGSYADGGVAIAHDSQGFLYLGGYTYSTDFPSGGSVVQPFPPLSASAPRVPWVMKLNPFTSNPNNVIQYADLFRRRVELGPQGYGGRRHGQNLYRRSHAHAGSAGHVRSLSDDPTEYQCSEHRFCCNHRSQPGGVGWLGLFEFLRRRNRDQRN